MTIVWTPVVAYAFRILQTTARLFQLLRQLVLDVLEVVELHLLVVHLLEQFVVLDLQSLALLSQVVDVLVQILDLGRQLARLSFEAFGGLFGGVLKRTDGVMWISVRRATPSPCPSALGRWWP